MQIELSELEAKAVIQMMDIAIKSVGLQGASTAIMFVNKVDVAMKLETAPPVFDTSKSLEVVNG